MPLQASALLGAKKREKLALADPPEPRCARRRCVRITEGEANDDTKLWAFKPSP
jgi:hypothetical protein